MKQHIEINDLSEFTIEQLEKLVILFEDCGLYHEAITRTIKAEKPYLEIITKHITIGKIIEILDIKEIKKIKGVWKDNIKKEWWFIQLENKGKFYEELELCDALWEAAKEILYNL